VLVAVIVVISRLVMLTLGSVFQRVESGELQAGWLDRDTAVPTRRITNVVIWLFALAMAYPYLPGAKTAAFQGLSVLVGLMVSIGASSIVSQGASGLILMYSRSLRKGGTCASARWKAR
jgi:small-conductance mechanosensitive channel